MKKTLAKSERSFGSCQLDLKKSKALSMIFIILRNTRASAKYVVFILKFLFKYTK